MTDGGYTREEVAGGGPCVCWKGGMATVTGWPLAISRRLCTKHAD